MTRPIAFLFILAHIASASATTILVLSTPVVTYIGADSDVLGIEIGGIKAAHNERPECKIHVANDYVWASAGPFMETHGPFDLGVLANRALRSGISFSHAVTELNKEISREYPEFRNRMLRSGTDPLFAKIDMVVANSRDAAYVSVTRFSEQAPQRMNCPKDCGGPLTLFRLGYHDAIDKILDRRPAIWKEMGIPQAMEYLIDAQAHETPQFVSGPVAILEIDKSSLHWISQGLCL